MQLTEILTDDSMMELTRMRTEDFLFEYYYEDVKKYKYGNINWHWHVEFEFLSVESGMLTCYIGTDMFSLEQGQSIFINSGVIHRFFASETCIVSNIVFPVEFLAKENSRIYEEYMKVFLEDDISYIIFQGKQEAEKGVQEQLEKLYQVCKIHNETWELDVYAIVFSIWKFLFLLREKAIIMDRKRGKGIKEIRFQKMNCFIEQNFFRKITLQEIAQSANISKSEALRCFQKIVNMTPIQYVNEYRLYRAKKLLLETNKTIMEISIMTGFESASYFNRLFKKIYKMTPKEMRQNKQNT